MFNKKLGRVEESKSIALSKKIFELKNKGENIIGMNVGESDIDTPSEIIKATKDAIDNGETRYSLVPGLVELRTAICKKLKNENDIEANIEEISISNGAKHVLYNIFQVLINDGDEVIILRPYWNSFPEIIRLAGGVPVYCETNNLMLDTHLVKEKITSKTKAIIVNSPNNPTGRIYPKVEMSKLYDLCDEYEIYLISDEAYEKLVFDDVKHFSPGVLENTEKKWVLTVQTFSKSYFMTGYRIGYVVGPKIFVDEYNKLQSHLSGNNCTFAQYGALKALTMDQREIDSQLARFETRRNFALNELSDLLPVEKPEGAFYLYPSVKHFYNDEIKNDMDLCNYLLDVAKVAVMPGSAYGHEGYIRIAYTLDEEVLKDGIMRIKDALNKLS